MKLRLLLIICCIQFCFTHSQNIRTYDIEKQAEHAKKKGYDPSYRVNYFENIIIRSFINSDVANFQYRALNNDATFNLVPVSDNLLGISLDYKWMAIEVSYSPSFLQNTNEFKDIKNSESFNFKINFFYSDRWRQELSYLYLKGFINKNPQTSVLDELRVLNNTIVKIYQGRTFFIENKNFSFRSHYAQTERQLRNAGSLIPKLSYSYSITEPNLMLSTNVINTIKLSSYNIIGQIGYLYTFVVNQKWYATLGIHPGVGYTDTNYTLIDAKNRRFKSVVFAFDSELSLGYNSYRWFYGISGNWRNYNNINNENGQVSRDSNYFMIHLGFRFNDNKPMRRLFGWFEDNLGF